MRDLNFLATTENVGYLHDPLPSRRDGQIRALVESLSTPTSYRALRRRITWDQAGTLEAFAERAASLAVRDDDEQLLVARLVALLLAGFDTDEQAELLGTRESVLVAPLLLKSAKKMRVRIRRLIDAVETVVGPEGAAGLEEFWMRSPHRLSLEAMGFRESTDPSSPLLYERIPRSTGAS